MVLGIFPNLILLATAAPWPALERKQPQRLQLLLIRQINHTISYLTSLPIATKSNFRLQLFSLRLNQCWVSLKL